MKPMVIIFIIVFICLTAVVVFAWEMIQDKYFHPRIYLVPDKKVFILSQGNYRIVFDTLTYITDSNDVNRLYTGRYSKLNAPLADAYLALDRDQQLVAVLPYYGKEYSSIALYAPGMDKPEWIRITEFVEKSTAYLQGPQK